MTWCPRCATGISNMETLSENYQETSHLSLYVRFPLLDRSGEYLIVWTTTPWTLAANVAAAVNPDLPYVKVEQDGEYYYIAEALLPVLKALKGRDKGDYHVVETLIGSDLIGWKYRGPFDELPAEQGIVHTIIPWKEVSANEGTGIVHIAPRCGREDYSLSKEFNLPVIAPVDQFGVYAEGFDWLTGQKASEVGQQIAENLVQKGLLYRPQNYKHRYPVCWRCKTELIFRLVDEWYISMDQLRYEIMDIVHLLEGDEFIFDVQTHHVDPEGPWVQESPASANFFRAFRPGCTEGDKLECLSRYYYAHDIFLESDTSIAVLSDTPSLDDRNDPLPWTEMKRTREVINDLSPGDNGRLRLHSIVVPNVGRIEDALDSMQARAEA